MPINNVEKINQEAILLLTKSFFSYEDGLEYIKLYESNKSINNAYLNDRLMMSIKKIINTFKNCNAPKLNLVQLSLYCQIYLTKHNNHQAMASIFELTEELAKKGDYSLLLRKNSNGDNALHSAIVYLWHHPRNNINNLLYVIKNMPIKKKTLILKDVNKENANAIMTLGESGYNKLSDNHLILIHDIFTSIEKKELFQMLVKTDNKGRNALMISIRSASDSFKVILNLIDKLSINSQYEIFKQQDSSGKNALMWLLEIKWNNGRDFARLLYYVFNLNNEQINDIIIQEDNKGKTIFDRMTEYYAINNIRFHKSRDNIIGKIEFNLPRKNTSSWFRSNGCTINYGRKFQVELNTSSDYLPRGLYNKVHGVLRELLIEGKTIKKNDEHDLVFHSADYIQYTDSNNYCCIF